MAIHFSLNGNLIPKDSDEGRRQSIKLTTAAGRYIIWNEDNFQVGTDTTFSTWGNDHASST